MTERRPIFPIHPGEVLAGELEELGVTAAQLAREIHVPSNRLYQLIAGKRAMTADTALRSRAMARGRGRVLAEPAEAI